ncbi:MAG: hypothetical protein ACI4IV_07150 [Acutalibacteraceae bacterium]
MAEIQPIYNLVFFVVYAIVGFAGVIFGGYALWEGFTADQPESKRKGITVLIATVVIIVFLVVAQGLFWNMISARMPS